MTKCKTNAAQCEEPQVYAGENVCRLWSGTSAIYRTLAINAVPPLMCPFKAVWLHQMPNDGIMVTIEFRFFFMRRELIICLPHTLTQNLPMHLDLELQGTFGSIPTKYSRERTERGKWHIVTLQKPVCLRLKIANKAVQTERKIKKIIIANAQIDIVSKACELFERNECTIVLRNVRTVIDLIEKQCRLVPWHKRGLSKWVYC